MTLVATPRPADDIAEILVNAEDIGAKVREMGARIAADYAGDPRREYEQFCALGLDGIITDFPDAAIAARATRARDGDGSSV